MPLGFSTWASVVSTLLLVALLACADEKLSPGGERYQQAATGIVREISTGLEWLAHDNGSEANWHAAERFCRGVWRAGRSEWRLPTIDELAGLYDPEANVGCGDAICHLGAPIQLTSAYLWSASPQNSDRRFYFDFRFGTRLAPRLRPDLTRRVLCVRSSLVD
jgi:hypothetical protein